MLHNIINLMIDDIHSILRLSRLIRLDQYLIDQVIVSMNHKIDNTASRDDSSIIKILQMRWNDITQNDITHLTSIQYNICNHDMRYFIHSHDNVITMITQDNVIEIVISSREFRVSRCHINTSSRCYGDTITICYIVCNNGSIQLS